MPTRENISTRLREPGADAVLAHLKAKAPPPSAHVTAVIAALEKNAEAVAIAEERAAKLRSGDTQARVNAIKGEKEVEAAEEAAANGGESKRDAAAVREAEQAEAAVAAAAAAARAARAHQQEVLEPKTRCGLT